VVGLTTAQWDWKLEMFYRKSFSGLQLAGVLKLLFFMGVADGLKL
jgi:hypothetical protein